MRSRFATLTIAALILTPVPARAASIADRDPGETSGLSTETFAPRFGTFAVYDPPGDRMVMFGGYKTTWLDDTWSLLLGSSTPVWHPLATTGPHPSARVWHGEAYDPVRRRMLVIGGSDRPGGCLNDVWQLDLSAADPTWSQVATVGTPPGPRYVGAMIYDPVRDRVLIFGGYCNSTNLNDTWALDLSGTPTWHQLAPSGTPPSPRYAMSMTYDPVGDRVLVFGGYDGVSYKNDLWALSLAGAPAWQQVLPAGAIPPPRYGHTASYDPGRQAIVVFGGYNGAFLNDMHVLSLAGSPTWSPVTTAPRPSARDFHTVTFDPPRDRMVLIGGNDSNALGDVWSLDGSTLTWTHIYPLNDSPPPDTCGGCDTCGVWNKKVGPQPSSRDHAAMIVDPVRGRIVEFGGYIEHYPYYVYTNDVWVLSLTTFRWSALTVAGTPPSARENSQAVYDPVRDRMLVIFGGTNQGEHNDVWSLSLSGTPTWTQLTPSGTLPAPRLFPACIYDPVRDRVLMVGGSVGSSEIWQLTLGGSGAWQQLSIAGGPAGRYHAAAAYDSRRDRMLLYGGSNSQVHLSDLWALSLSGTPQWTSLASVNGSPPVFKAPSAAYDQARDRMLLFSGLTYPKLELWAFTFKHAIAAVDLRPAGYVPRPGQYTTGLLDVARDQVVVVDGHCCLADSGTFRMRLGLHVDVAINPQGKGTVSQGPSLCDSSGSVVTLTAQSPPTWVLSDWSGDTTGAANPLAVTVNGYKQFVAHFVRQSTPDTCGRWSFALAYPTPRARIFAYSAYDPVRKRLVLFGGEVLGGSVMFNDLWQFSFATNAWQPLAATGSPPGPRGEGGMIYDPVRDRMLVVCGVSGSTSLNEVWSLTLSGTPAWSLLTTSGAPAGRRRAATIYDPIRDRVLVFGAWNFNSNETWQLDLTASPPAWSLIPATTPPSPRFAAAAIYDPLRDRMLVFGGEHGSSPINTLYQELWSLDLAGAPAWTRITPASGLPPPRSYAQFAYDAARDRFLLQGGSGITAFYDDTWAITLRHGPESVNLTTSAGKAEGSRYSEPFAYDPEHDQLLLFGGSVSDSLDDTYHLPLGIMADVAIEPPGSGTVSRSPDAPCDGAGSTVTFEPQPAAGYRFAFWSGDVNGTEDPLPLVMDGYRALVAHFRPISSAVPDAEVARLAIERVAWAHDGRLGDVAFTLPRRGAAALDVFDVAGRRRVHVLLEDAGAGAHQATLRAAVPLGAGVYFVRVVQGEAKASARFVLLR